jgi:hypothetical protein
MLNRVRSIAVAALLVGALAAGATAAQKRVARGPVPGEDAHRSVTAHVVSLMEHCKAVNKLARNKGDFDVALAREHAAEVSRAAGAAARHFEGYMSALGAEQRMLVADAGSVQQRTEGEVARLAAALEGSLKAAAPDRKQVATHATDLYLAAKDFITAHKAAAKTLKISAASPPRKAAPRKPRKPKAASEETAMVQ